VVTPRRVFLKIDLSIYLSIYLSFLFRLVSRPRPRKRTTEFVDLTVRRLEDRQRQGLCGLLRRLAHARLLR